LSDSTQDPIRRRAALAKLGLTALAVYAAPSVVHLDRSANAQVRPSCNSKGKGKGNPWCNTKGKSNSKSSTKGKSRGKGNKGRNTRNYRSSRNVRNNQVGNGRR
jgi:hypothetical protein